MSLILQLMQAGIPSNFPHGGRHSFASSPRSVISYTVTVAPVAGSEIKGCTWPEKKKRKK